MYSGDPKTGHSKTGNIRKPDILKVGFNHSYLTLLGCFYAEAKHCIVAMHNRFFGGVLPYELYVNMRVMFVGKIK